MPTLWALGVATFLSISPFQLAQLSPHLAGAVETDRSAIYSVLSSADLHALLTAGSGAELRLPTEMGAERGPRRLPHRPPGVHIGPGKLISNVLSVNSCSFN